MVLPIAGVPRVDVSYLVKRKSMRKLCAVLAIVTVGACSDDRGVITPPFFTGVDGGVLRASPEADDGILSAIAFWTRSEDENEVFIVRWNQLRWVELAGFALTVHENSVADEVLFEVEFAADATEGEITFPADQSTYWFELRWFADAAWEEGAPAIRTYSYASPRRVIARVGNNPPTASRVPWDLADIVYDRNVELHPRRLDGLFQDRENDNDLTHTISSADTTILSVWENDGDPDRKYERLYMRGHMFDTSTVVTVIATDPQGETAANEWEVTLHRFHTSLPIPYVPPPMPPPPPPDTTTKRDTTTTTPGGNPPPPPPPADTICDERCTAPTITVSSTSPACGTVGNGEAADLGVSFAVDWGIGPGGVPYESGNLRVGGRACTVGAGAIQCNKDFDDLSEVVSGDWSYEESFTGHSGRDWSRVITVTGIAINGNAALSSSTVSQRSSFSFGQASYAWYVNPELSCP